MNLSATMDRPIKLTTSGRGKQTTHFASEVFMFLYIGWLIVLMVHFVLRQAWLVAVLGGCFFFAQLISHPAGHHRGTHGQGGQEASGHCN